jgi:hypothetical protein
MHNLLRNRLTHCVTLQEIRGTSVPDHMPLGLDTRVVHAGGSLYSTLDATIEPRGYDFWSQWHVSLLEPGASTSMLSLPPVLEWITHLHNLYTHPLFFRANYSVDYMHTTDAQFVVRLWQPTNPPVYSMYVVVNTGDVEAETFLLLRDNWALNKLPMQLRALWSSIRATSDTQVSTMRQFTNTSQFDNRIILPNTPTYGCSFAPVNGAAEWSLSSELFQTYTVASIRVPAQSVLLYTPYQVYADVNAFQVPLSRLHLSTANVQSVAVRVQEEQDRLRLQSSTGTNGMRSSTGSSIASSTHPPFVSPASSSSSTSDPRLSSTGTHAPDSSTASVDVPHVSSTGAHMSSTGGRIVYPTSLEERLDAFFANHTRAFLVDTQLTLSTTTASASVLSALVCGLTLWL